MRRAKVFVRVDASSRTGGGHLSRCLALADAFLERNCPVTFLCGEIDEQYEELITRRGHEMKRLALGSPVSGHRREDGFWLRADAEASVKLISASSNAGKILIVDHYRIDKRWETALKSHVDCVFVIDDLADRTHDCRILLDQTYGGGAVRYKDLVPADCEGLFGPTYALLRPAFALMRKKQKRDDPDGDSFVVHVFFGSEDAAGNTQRFSRILMTLDKVREVRVAVSPWYRD